MKLAASSHQKIERFFREYFQDETIKLPNFNVYCGGFAQRFTKLFKISGITLGRNVIISPDFVERDAESDLPLAAFDLIVHEATHVLQYQKQGFFGFLFSYLQAWIRFIRQEKSRDVETRWQAYYAIPHEEEARAAASAYREWRLK